MLNRNHAFAALALFSSAAWSMSDKPSELNTDIVFTNSTLDTLTVNVSGSCSISATSD